MADLPTHARVVIIGGGCVGTSGLYHLASMGWTDCVLLEKSELTAGSTWHAAGNVPTFSTSWAVMAMQRYSAELYRGLAEAVDYPISYHVTGSLRLAHGIERMREFELVCGMGRRQGMALAMMTRAEMKDAYPFMETHDLEGGLFDPNDGNIDPAQLTQALAKGARDLGAVIVRHNPATGIDRQNGEWIVHTVQGPIRCEIVVNAAGYYAQQVGEWFRPFGGRRVPMAVMSHQYMLTEEIPALVAWSREYGRKLPILRDVDTSYYLRQEIGGLNLGPYERNCRAHWAEPGDPMPDDFSFQLYPDDLERLEWYIEDAMARVPILSEAGVSKVINGPIPYAPDGLPLIGPMPGIRNAFEACVFTFGIAQAGGAGKVLAEWIIQGRPEGDMWAVDPRRFTGHADDAYCVEKAKEVYGHEYAIHFRHHAWSAARGRKLSPVHDRMRELGAVFGAYNGWERANWFAKAGDDISQESTQTYARGGPWEPRVREECLAVRDHAGVIELSGMTRFELSGDGAAEWLSRQITGRLPAIGAMNLAYVANDQGRIVTEFSLMRHAQDRFTLITAAIAQWHDRDLLTGSLQPGLHLADRSDTVSMILVTGPKARALLAPLTEGDLERPWLTHHAAVVAGHPVHLARVSFAGELGWEIHGRVEVLPTIYDALIEAGAKPFGMFALDSLRQEKGYRGWKADLSSDYDLIEAGLCRFIDFDKPFDFKGKQALLEAMIKGPARRFAQLVIESPDFDALPMSTIWHGEVIVGEVTSGCYGYRVDCAIALSMIRADLAPAGTAVEVDVLGKRYPATVKGSAALWDPRNERLKV